MSNSMRWTTFIRGTALVLLATGTCLHAQNKENPSQKEKPPAKEKEWGGKTLSQWVKEVRDQDPGIRERAIQTISFPIFREDARKKAGKVLISELADRDPGLRANAVVTLGLIGLDGEDVASGLAAIGRLLSDTQAIVRFRAAMTLATFGPNAKDSLPALCTAAKDQFTSWEVRKAAAYALGRVGADSDAPNSRALVALRDCMKDHCAEVRLEAITSLIMLGKPATHNERTWLGQALRANFADKDKIVAIWARVAVLRMEEKVTEAHLKAICAYLKSPETDVRSNALRALGILGKDAQSHLADIVATLNDPDPAIVMTAIESLKFMGAAAKEAIPDLNQLAAGKNEAIKQSAKIAIEEISKKSPAAKNPEKKK